MALFQQIMSLQLTTSNLLLNYQQTLVEWNCITGNLNTFWDVITRLYYLFKSSSTSCFIRLRNRIAIVHLWAIYEKLMEHFFLPRASDAQQRGNHVMNRCIKFMINSIGSVKLEYNGQVSRHNPAIWSPYKNITSIDIRPWKPIQSLEIAVILIETSLKQIRLSHVGQVVI